jgi:hypothetical protein
MDDNDNNAITQNRSWIDNSATHAQRVVVDVAELLAGSFARRQMFDSDDSSGVGNLTRRLFDDEAPLGQSDDDEDSVVAQEVTIASREVLPEVYTARIDDQVEDLPVIENENMVENELLDPDAIAEPVLDASKRKRYRFSYAKKHFYAESALYLKADPALSQPEVTPELLGQIIACPSKKNNYEYQVRWIRQKNGN